MRRLLGVLLIALAPAAASADPPSASDSAASAPARSDAQLDAERPPRTPEEARAADEAAARRARDKAAEQQAAARAQRPAAPGAAAEAAPPPPMGRYGGVELDGKNPPPHQSRGRQGGPAQLTWLGFRIDNGVPTVFAELTRPVVWTLDEAAGALVYTLQQASIPLANNRRPLDVSAFGTPVRSVVAARHGKDVQVTIRINPVAGAKPIHRERNQDAPGGLKFLVVELPLP